MTTNPLPLDNHQAIKKAMYSLLESKSFKKITVNDLCIAASISRSTFYKTYHDKYDILEQENHLICTNVDQSLKNFFTMTDLSNSLKQLIAAIDHPTFLQLIDIEEGTVNLRKELKLIFEKNYLLYYESKRIEKKWDVSSEFAKDLFCSVGLTFLESSIKSPQKQAITQNTDFIKEMVAMFLTIEERL